MISWRLVLTISGGRCKAYLEQFRVNNSGQSETIPDSLEIDIKRPEYYKNRKMTKALHRGNNAEVERWCFIRTHAL